MTLKLTTQALAGAYNFLRSTPPFSAWGLPDDVVFRVTRTRDKRGAYYRAGPHVIEVSEVNSGHTINVLMTMAHEMVHLRIEHARLPGRRVEHGATFRRLARQVCRHHGFDPKAF